MSYKNYFDKYTYVLTNNGWKLFKDIKVDEDLVAQFDSSFNITFVACSGYDAHSYEGVMITITSSSGLSLLTVTPDSMIPYLKDDGSGGKHNIDYIHNIDLEKNNYLYTAGKRISYELPELYLDQIYTKEELDLIQSNAVIRGFSVIINDSENNGYYLNTNTAPFDFNDIVKSQYKDMIYTVSVPSGMIVTRRFNKVIIGCTNV